MNVLERNVDHHVLKACVMEMGFALVQNIIYALFMVVPKRNVETHAYQET